MYNNPISCNADRNVSCKMQDIANGDCFPCTSLVYMVVPKGQFQFSNQIGTWFKWSEVIVEIYNCYFND